MINLKRQRQKDLVKKDEKRNEQNDRKNSITLQTRGFVYQSSDIYGGFGAVYDYGPLGVELKNNIANAWWKEMTRNHENIVGLDSSILMHPKFGKHLGM